jgi:hypothetical protein
VRTYPSTVYLMLSQIGPLILHAVVLLSIRENPLKNENAKNKLRNYKKRKASELLRVNPEDVSEEVRQGAATI